MPFWSGQTLAHYAETFELIKPFDPELIQGAAYELRLGDHLATSQDKKSRLKILRRGMTPGYRSGLKSTDRVQIPAGQFALLISKEEVSIPPNKIGLLSMKAGIKLDGLINVSGFHVDPGYAGRLIFSVFNAGASEITLQPDQPLFLLFFAGLDETSEEKYRYKKPGFRDIPPSLVQKLSLPVPSIYGTAQEVSSLKETVLHAKWTAIAAVTIAGFTLTVCGWLVNRALSATVQQASSASVSVQSKP